MALVLRLYSFQKRYNSTARPTDQGRAVEVTLKNETSLNNPVFLLSGDKPMENYALFEGVYYFVEDVRSIRTGLWEIVCAIDILATAKDEITASDAYVEYRTGGYTDLPDTRIALRAGARFWADAAEIGFTSYGHYILAATGISGVNVWELDTYAKLQTILQNVANWADNLIVAETDFDAALKKAFSQTVSSGSAMECIRACKWVPFPVSGGVGGFVSLGRYETGVAAGSVPPEKPYRTGEVTIPISFSRDGYLRTPPYTEVILYLPFVGVVNISSAAFANTDRVRVLYSMDYRNGAIAYKVFAGGLCVGTYGGDSSVDIPVGISNVSAQALITGITAASVSAAYGNIAGIVGGSLGAFTPTPSTVGGLQGGAGAGLSMMIQVIIMEHPVSGNVGNMDEVQGNPYFNTVTLGTISGYVKTRGASIKTMLRGALKDQLNNMLDSGIFIE